MGLGKYGVPRIIEAGSVLGCADDGTAITSPENGMLAWRARSTEIER